MSKKQSIKNQKKRILITGGAGFIGSHLVEKLLSDHFVVIYDNFRRNTLEYTTLQSHPHLKLIKGDVLDSKALKKAFKDIDTVMHLAAVAGVSSYEKNPLLTLEVDAWGTYHVLKLASEHRVSHTILFSSSEVYGPDAGDVNETSFSVQGPATESRWSYGVGKLVGDHFAFAFSKMTKLNITIVRPFNIYGPRQIGEGAIQIFVKRALKGEKIQIRGDGNQIRSWCYIDDFVDGVLKMIQNSDAFQHIFNIGNPQGISINELAHSIIRLSNSQSKIEYVPHPHVDILKRFPDIKKAKRLLKYRPKTSLDKGLEKTIKWHKNI